MLPVPPQAAQGERMKSDAKAATRAASGAADVLRHAERICRARGVRFTPLRRLVLMLILQQARPLKAYDLLALLQVHRPGAAPPAVYRSIAFLRRQGFIRKLHAMRAYTGCQGEPMVHEGESAVFICTRCRRTIELDQPSMADLINLQAGRLGFAMQVGTIEIHGTCMGSCAREPAGGHD